MEKRNARAAVRRQRRQSDGGAPGLSFGRNTRMSGEDTIDGDGSYGYRELKNRRDVKPLSSMGLKKTHSNCRTNTLDL